MPVLGSGIIPGSGAVASQLEATIRRAFVKPLVVQWAQATPTLSGMVGNAAMAMGGVSSVTVPVQGTALTTTQGAGFSGSFTVPTTQTGIQNAEFNLCMMVTPIPFLGTEAMLEVDHTVIPILEARMNDAGNSMVDYASTKLATNHTLGLDLQGFPAAIDDGTSGNTSYGGITFSTNTWWKAYVKSAGSSVTITRQLVLQYIQGLTKWSGGEKPTFIVCGMATWVSLAQDYVGSERYNQDGGGRAFDTIGGPPRSGYTALMVGDVPVFCDPYFTEGTLWMVNTRYLSFYIHNRVNFAFTGFASMLPNAQLGYIGALVTALNLVNTKPKSAGQVTGFGFATI
ncbi:MAG: phage major capsid protein [Candidatus Acidiferrales bacterium]